MAFAVIAQEVYANNRSFRRPSTYCKVNSSVIIVFFTFSGLLTGIKNHAYIFSIIYIFSAYHLIISFFEEGVNRFRKKNNRPMVDGGTPKVKR